MSFQFGFASEDGDDENAASGGVGRVADEHVTGAQIQPVQKHKLADLVGKELFHFPKPPIRVL